MVFTKGLGVVLTWPAAVLPHPGSHLPVKQLLSDGFGEPNRVV